MKSLSKLLLGLKQSYYSEKIQKVLIKLNLHTVIKNIYYNIYQWSLDRVRTENILGFNMQFYQDSYVEHKQINTSLGEVPIIRQIVAHCQPEDVVFDIGGNIGIHACLIRKSMGDDGGEKVISFEPHPSNAERLRQNAELNQVSIRTEQMALSNKQGTVTLHSADRRPGEGKHALRTNTESDSNSIEVESIPGDLYIERSSCPVPNILKIDVEGAEYQVLQGLSDTLQKEQCRAVFMEVHRSKLSVFETTVGEIEQYLKEKGFTINVIYDRDSEYFIKATK